ncbi:unnamed protein product [Psylliodes chrysocephalus]|uniref:Immediate early response 3-interacting protein 1 n=1 Tax=Psylliodes chrysocephalus TaxID=3402493 RepID=A0A9P0CME4_9CUCU|nr:unnamed protein product [Psylliodes chrysocephala]
MAFTLSLWNLFETSLLCLNALAIINEERVVTKCDADTSLESDMCFKNAESKSCVYNIVNSMTTLSKYPIILLNLITIILKLILGS